MALAKGLADLLLGAALCENIAPAWPVLGVGL